MVKKATQSLRLIKDQFGIIQKKSPTYYTNEN